MPVLSAPLAATALALAGVRSGASVLDLAPASGLGPALRAGAGPTGTVTEAAEALDPALGGPDHAVLVSTTATPEAVLARLAAVRPPLTRATRVTLGCAGDRPWMLQVLSRASGWALVHLEVVAAAAGVDPATLVFAVLRAVPPAPAGAGASSTRVGGPGDRWV